MNLLHCQLSFFEFKVILVNCGVSVIECGSGSSPFTPLELRSTTHIPPSTRITRNLKLFKLQRNSYLIEYKLETFKSTVHYIGKEKENRFFDGIFHDNLWQYNLIELKTLKSSEEKILMQEIYYKNFLRLFINKSGLNRIKYTSNERLLPDASNLESVLKRILKEEPIKEEFLEWLDLFVPGFSNIEIHSDNIGGTDTLLIYEEGITKPFTKNLISDGTYNILALLTAVYQTAEPHSCVLKNRRMG